MKHPEVKAKYMMQGKSWGRFLVGIAMAWAWLDLGLQSHAAGLGETPISFFTNVSERLFQSQLGRSLIPIQVYPSNEYTPAVHRLLQVAANLYDASTNHSTPAGFPSVFRPVIARTASNIFICGFTNDNDPGTARSWFANSPDGIPMVVGAKKGLPNFNEFVFQTAMQFTRRLEVARPSATVLPNQTNQLLLLSLSNLLGIEIWNAYSKPFSNDFQVFVTNILSMTLSNAADGSVISLPPKQVGVDLQVFAATNGNWYSKRPFPYQSGYAGGFMLPFYTNQVFLPNSRHTGAAFDGLTNSFLPRTGEFPVPDWRLIMSNRLIYIMSSGGQILDAVALSYQTNLNLSAFLLGMDDVYPYTLAGLWNTNRISNPATLSTPTDGIMQQLRISMGQPGLSETDWKTFNGGSEKQDAIDSFKQFVQTVAPGSNLFAQAPFTATRRFSHTVTWQANDPLVHYMAEDLAGITNEIRFLRPNDIVTNAFNLGRLNERYDPWLGNPLNDSNDAIDPDDTYVGLKDPGVFSPDDWNFPDNLMANPGLLGRVHRGTPWQTIYLKAEVAPANRWVRQSPDVRTHPTNDWKLASLLLALWNTNDPAALFSINQTSEPAWAAILDGLTVLSNTMPNYSRMASTNFDYSLIDSNSTQAGIIATAINQARSSRVPPYFRQVGELLATPQLTVASPWLNRSDPDFLTFSLTDEAYEKIPEQLLPRLRADPLLTIPWKDGELHAHAVAFADHWYALERSRDLQNWMPVATRFSENDAFDFPEALGTDPGDAFYRLRLIAAPPE